MLSRDELKRLLPVLEASSRPYAAALRFMAMTLARREEVGTARWRDLDLETATWVIPVTKNGRPHVVPQPRQAVDLLRSRLPNGADGAAFDPPAEVLIFATETGGALVNWDRECKAFMAASETTGWTRHDLRRTGATLLGEMGELPHVIEACLNHSSIHSQLAALYNRTRYRPQVAAALQRLADAFDGLTLGAAEILPFQRGVG